MNICSCCLLTIPLTFCRLFMVHIFCIITKNVNRLLYTRSYLSVTEESINLQDCLLENVSLCNPALASICHIGKVFIVEFYDLEIGFINSFINNSFHSLHLLWFIQLKAIIGNGNKCVFDVYGCIIHCIAWYYLTIWGVYFDSMSVWWTLIYFQHLILIKKLTLVFCQADSQLDISKFKLYFMNGSQYLCQLFHLFQMTNLCNQPTHFQAELTSTGFLRGAHSRNCWN